MRHPDPHIFHQTPETLAAWCAERGMAKFRATQILEWVYDKLIIDPAQMTNLSARDRDTLAAEMTFLSGDIVREAAASDGTRKLLVEWGEERDEETERGRDEVGSERALPVIGALVGSDPSRQTECVMIPALGTPPLRGGRSASGDRRGPRPSHRGSGPAPGPSGRRPPTESGGTRIARRTACISSQVGCPVGCRFCASGLGGLDGNLSTGRIVEQVWRLNRMLAGAADSSEAHPASPPGDRGATPRITNIVFMGMGEPLANFKNVTNAVRTLAAPWGPNISARKITISTVGLPAAIEKLADQLELPVTLALSLHAPTDEIRRSLIPWAEYSTIDELLGACRKWFEKTGREITLEYTLMAEVNDRPEHARLLAKLCKRLRANVNLIRYNEVEGLPFGRPASADVQRFQQELRDAGVNVHIRASRGRDIAAACGQLRHEAAPS
ncbi:MAG: 23S rRNA (adenine(2503)-C(2))-methyltransferase RlmN [Phycisphaerales bacterium JB039]